MYLRGMTPCVIPPKKEKQMIYGQLNNGELDWLKNERFRMALSYIREKRQCFPPCGEYEIDGRHVYAMIQAYDTKEEEECGWEGHRKYIDLHYIVSGEETVLVTELPIENEGYDDTIDLLRGSAQASVKLPMRSDCFAVFFPNDFHKAKCHLNGVHGIRKILIKIEL